LPSVNPGSTEIGDELCLSTSASSSAACELAAACELTADGAGNDPRSSFPVMIVACCSLLLKPTAMCLGFSGNLSIGHCHMVSLHTFPLCAVP
jgi:hypothetical protein